MKSIVTMAQPYCAALGTPVSLTNGPVPSARHELTSRHECARFGADAHPLLAPPPWLPRS